MNVIRAGAMELHILEFASLLRRNGLRVSPAETLDAFAAITTVGLANRSVFKATLRSSMVKRAVDIAAFDELFETYFAGAGDLVGDVAATAIERLDLSPADVQRIVDQLREILDAMGTQPTDLTRALLTMDAGRLEDALRRAAEASGLDGIQRPFQQGQFGYGMAANLGTGAVEQDLAALRAHLDALQLDTELRQAFERFLEQRLEDLRDMIGRMVRLRLTQNDLAGREKVRIQSLAEKSFYYLTEDEIRRMNDAVTRLAQRLKGPFPSSGAA